MTDSHIDLYYQPGTNANCVDPMCCRNSSGMPNTASDAAGYWGSSPTCDPPL
jgi:sphingomyelin phosphodiesterase